MAAFYDFYDGIQLSQPYRANMRRLFTFYHKSPGVPGTNLNEKDELNLEPPSGLEPGTSLDW